MATRIIEVVVATNGEATVQTKGYDGTACLQASRFLEQALGISGAVHATAEFYQAAAQEQQLQQR